MEDTDPQRALPRGVTRLRMGDRTIELDDHEWELQVRSGRVPPDVLVCSLLWTRGLWRRAETLEVYHLFLPTRPWGRLSRRPAGGLHPPAKEAIEGLAQGAHPRGLPRALWGTGISATKVLLFANIVISVVLFAIWRADYSTNLWGFSAALRGRLFDGWAPVLFLPLFLHASSSHLVANMLALTAAGAAVEEFYGASRTSLLYLFAGICGALLSLLRGNPVLSVGASGAIMGLYGVVLVFLLRYRQRFSERQRVKVLRVYLPLVVLAVMPSLFMADLLSHVGGFLGGILLALFVTPHPNHVPWSEGEARDAVRA